MISKKLPRNVDFQLKNVFSCPVLHYNLENYLKNYIAR